MEDVENKAGAKNNNLRFCLIFLFVLVLAVLFLCGFALGRIKALEDELEHAVRPIYVTTSKDSDMPLP